jgi:hypothetical protein
MAEVYIKSSLNKLNIMKNNDCIERNGELICLIAEQLLSSSLLAENDKTKLNDIVFIYKISSRQNMNLAHIMTLILTHTQLITK